METTSRIDEEKRQWYALYTRPRFEKKVDQLLLEKGIESFLPLCTTVRYWSDRKKKIQEPLIPSYIFVHANRTERLLSLQSSGVIRMIFFNNQPARIPDDQIENLRTVIEHGYNPQPFQYLNRGDEVEVVAGPLRGVHGYFIEERGQEHLIISVHPIRQSVAIQVERSQIRKVQSKVSAGMAATI
jgi:transcription antitermination factor NusG